MVGFIVYSMIILAVGFMGGLMAKHIIDRDAIRHANLKNLALRRESAYLRNLAKGNVIEIHDDRVDAVEEVDFSNDW